MDHSIIMCHEEEFAPFMTYMWRRPAGWHPVLFYCRGPAGMWPISGLILTLIGIWKFVRPPQTLIGSESQFINRRVREVCSNLGSYGTGGPGFLGLRFSNGWIVYRLWGADGWLTLNTKLLQESLFPEELATYGIEKTASANELIGAILNSIECSTDHYDLTFTKNDSKFCLSLRRDGTAVPVLRGDGRPRIFADDEELKDAVVVSRKARLWLPA